MEITANKSSSALSECGQRSVNPLQKHVATFADHFRESVMQRKATTLVYS